ncbi:MAG: hypothetical protein CMJ94_07360 [Planctomycetes bacterium]|nr:hypothetical protein [Planctomycetota bacterium]
MHLPRRLFLPFLAAASLSFAAGCGNHEATPISPDFAGRLAAAEAISSTTEADEALVAIAIDAGKEGYADVARKAIRAISSQTVADSAAAEAAVALARSGDAMQATELADLISSSVMRDTTLSKIATRGD